MFTLAHLIDSFVADARVRVRAGTVEPSTLRWYEDGFKHFAPLRDMPADAVRTYHLAGVELTNHTARVLRRLYRFAVDNELVPRDPFAKLAVPPCGERQRVLTRAELRRLYIAAPRPLRRLLFVQLRTIARPGEIRSLTWGQVNLAERVIVLTKFKAQKRRKVRVRARCIPLALVLVRLLANMRRNAGDPGPDELVFRSTRGKPWTPNGARCAMRAARRRAGLDGGGEPVCAYHLRHTGATNAVNNGTPLKLLAEIMGQTGTGMTERYVHLSGRDTVAAIEQATARPKRAV